MGVFGNTFGNTLGGQQGTRTDSAVSFYAKTRSGVTLVDEVAAQNATILLPHIRIDALGRIFKITDNGGLDIGTSDFTLCGWIKTNSDKTVTRYLLGKYVETTLVSGAYGIRQDGITGYLKAIIQTSAGPFMVQGSTDFTTMNWVFYRMDINQTTKKLRFFVNEVQVGTDTAFTGTFPAMNNMYEFYFGGANITDGTTVTRTSANYFSDTYIYNKLLTTNEVATLYARGAVAGAKAHWSMSSVNCYDLSSNGFNGVISVANYYTILYSEYGSRQALDIGYSVYSKLASADVLVPLNDNGDTHADPIIPVGYYLKENILTNAFMNYCECKILFAGANFDRSNATIFTDATRLGYYDVSAPKVWHSSELTNFKFNTLFLNDGYKGIHFVKNEQIYENKRALEIFSFNSEKTGIALSKVYRYCNENGINSIEYYWEDLHICTQFGDKILAFTPGINILKYSEDSGATWLHQFDTSSIFVYTITMAHIFDNGNIMFASRTKIYYSTDKLATYHECTTIGIDGNTFTPTSISNFKPETGNPKQYFDGNEVRIWGNYSINADTAYININVWSTVDYGLTVKSIYKAGVTGTPSATLPARHIHDVEVFTDPTDSVQKIFVDTGDGTDECNSIVGTFDPVANTATWAKWAGDNVNDTAIQNDSYYKQAGVVFYNGYIYFCSDAQTASLFGIYRVKFENYLDSTKFERLYHDAAQQIYMHMINGIMFCTTLMSKDVMVSTDYKNFKKYTMTGGVTLSSSWGLIGGSISVKTSGHMRLEILEQGENLDSYTTGQVLQLKAVKI